MALTKVTYSMIDGAPYNVLDYGAVGDGVANDTVAIQSAIDAAFTAGGGVVNLPAGTFLVSTSALTETLWNAGVAWPATDGCLVLRDGVSLIGEGANVTTIKSNNANKTVIQIADGNNTKVANLTIEGGGSSTGAGHGIIQLLSTNDNSTVCENMVFDGLYITNVGSYAIGIENGNCFNVVVSNVRAYDIGADGIDFKNRGTLKNNTGIFISNVCVEKYGQRVSLGSGMAGIDIRGVANVSNVQVKMVSVATIGHTGIRFRTASAADPNQEWAAKSSLTNFYVYSDDTGSTNVDNYGLAVGSKDVTVSNGYIENCYHGVATSGNANDVSDNVSFSQINVNNASYRAFWTAIGSDYSKFVNCLANNSGVGFRIESAYTTLISCQAVNTTTSFSSSTAANPTAQTIGCVFADDFGFSVEKVSAGVVGFYTKGTSANIETRIYSKGNAGVELRTGDERAFRAGGVASAVNCISVLNSITSESPQVVALGDDTDIDIWVREKGNGKVKFGRHTPSADAPVSGYIEIKDSGGTIRKLAVIS